jgi:hypothetical protein
VDEAASAAVTVGDEGTSYTPHPTCLELIGVAAVDFEVAEEEHEGDLLDEVGCEAVPEGAPGVGGAVDEVVLGAAQES